MSQRLPLVFEPAVLVVSLLSAVSAAALSMHLFFIFGVVPAVELLTATLLGGLWALGRLARRFLSEELLLLAQTAAAVSGVAAALSLALPISLAWAADLPALVPPLLVGAALFSALALVTLCWLFGTAWAPASAPWSPVPALPIPAAPIGHWLRLLCLALGLVIGFWAGLAFAAPLVAAFGLAFVGSGLGIGALAAGLLARPTLPYLSSLGLASQDLPAGALLGAALVASLQVTLLALFRRVRAARTAPRTASAESTSGGIGGVANSLHGRLVGLALVACLFLATALLAVLVADAGPLEFSPGPMLGLVVLLSLLALTVQLWSGLAAAWTGLVPILGGALAMLVLGASLQLEPSTLLLLVALATVGGPLAGALGAQLQAGAGDPGGRLPGQQVLAGLLGLAVALAVVTAGHRPYLEAGYLPPAATALAAALAVSQGSLSLAALVPGLGLGALLQLLGGPTTQLGLLFGTGLLLDFEPAGWALLWGLLVRILAALLTGGHSDPLLSIFGLGCIAGEFLRLLTGGS